MAGASTSTSAAKADRPFFGRQDDLDALLEQAQTPGLTIIPGPPQIGKTRLLAETRSRLVERGFIVGYAESTGRHCDLVLLALRDAYAQAAASDKLAVLIDEAKENRLGILDGVSPGILAVVLPAPLRMVVDAAQGGATTVSSVALEPTQLTTDEALSLAAFLATASPHPLVLVLDAWERSLFAPGIDAIRSLLGHARRPGCHVVLGVTTHEPFDEESRQRLIGSAGGPRTTVRELGRLDLREVAEQRRLADYLASRVPAAREVEQAAILELLDGLPGILHTWLEAAPETPDELVRLADDARHGVYPDLRPRFLEQCREGVRTAGFLAGLAILPRMNDDETWRSLSPVLLDGVQHDAVQALCARGVLEAAEGCDASVPGYGHETRHDAARRTWLDDDGGVLRTVARSEVKRLVPRLAEHVRDFGWESYLFAAALAAVHDHRDELQLKGELLTVCACAATLFPSWSTPAGSHPVRGKAAETARRCPSAVALVALTLASAVCSADQAEDRTVRDDLLGELRRLRESHRDDEKVRELLAVALAGAARTAFREGDLSRRDALLEELARLCAGHPRDTAVCEHLGEALADSVGQACRLKDRTSRDALLKGLRALCVDHPGDAMVREHLAVALVNGIDEACDEADQACRDSLIDELRALSSEHPGDALVREQLAVALLDAVEQAFHERHRARRNSLLQTLRRLSGEHPGDAAVRERFGAALALGVTRAIWEGDRASGEALLKELRALSAQAPADITVCEQLSAALSDDLTRARWDDDWPRYQALLDELRALCARHPDDEAVFDRLAAALSNPPAAPPSGRA